jgi:hypothetical protein
MSGGHWEYQSWKINNIADDIEDIISKNGMEYTEEELECFGYRDPDWYEKYPEDLFHPKYSDETINHFKEAVKIFRLAAIYEKRIDWFLSGDDGEESFLERLTEELTIKTK